MLKQIATTACACCNTASRRLFLQNRISIPNYNIDSRNIPDACKLFSSCVSVEAKVCFCFLLHPLLPPSISPSIAAPQPTRTTDLKLLLALFTTTLGCRNLKLTEGPAKKDNRGQIRTKGDSPHFCSGAFVPFCPDLSPIVRFCWAFRQLNLLENKKKV